jgi:hypothetical protein
VVDAAKTRARSLRVSTCVIFPWILFRTERCASLRARSRGSLTWTQIARTARRALGTVSRRACGSSRRASPSRRWKQASRGPIERLDGRPRNASGTIFVVEHRAALLLYLGGDTPKRECPRASVTMARVRSRVRLPEAAAAPVAAGECRGVVGAAGGGAEVVARGLARPAGRVVERGIPAQAMRGQRLHDGTGRGPVVAAMIAARGLRLDRQPGGVAANQLEPAGRHRREVCGSQLELGPANRPCASMPRNRPAWPPPRRARASASASARPAPAAMRLTPIAPRLARRPLTRVSFADLSLSVSCAR